MNFSMILHLLRTDWQRLRRPLVWLWLLLLAAALPWLLHRPGDWRMPQVLNLSWSGGLGPLPQDFTRWSWVSNFIFLAELGASLLALILAAMLGGQWVKQPVSPLRGRERFSGLAMALLVFIVLPQWLLAFVNLLLHGFLPTIAAMAAGATALTLWLMLGLVAALAAWLPSLWLMLGGCAALVTAVGFISEFYRPLDYVLRGYPLLPLLPAGPREWLFGALAIVGLATLLPVFRRRLNGPWRIAVAVGVILTAGVPALLLPQPQVHANVDRSIRTAAIGAKLQGIQLQSVAEAANPGGSRFQVTARLKAVNCPPEHGLRFKPIRGWISQNGKRIAAIMPENDPYISVQDEVGAFMPDAFTVGTNRAVRKALPGKSQDVSLSQDDETAFITLGQCELASNKELLPEQDAELQMEFQTTLFRYETAWNSVLGDKVAEIQDGNLKWRIRKHASKDGNPTADVLVVHPALGISKNPDQVRWDARAFEHYQLFFHLPATDFNLNAAEELLSASGPLYSGAGWERHVIESHGNSLPIRDPMGLRLIALRPVAVATFATSVVTRFRPWRGGDTADFDLTNRHSVDKALYRREWFSRRPDPQTCTRDEFGRWLRVAARVYPGTSGSQNDLASFAPRFADVMAKVSYHESVEAGLRLGMQESSRHAVLENIDRLEWPERLADVAWDRGWLGEASESILRRYREGSMTKTNALLALEDASIYPELVAGFLARPERETYEKLRLLPGIEPLIADEISKAMGRMEARQLRDNLASPYPSAPYGPFLYAAKQGDAAALQTILELHQAGGSKSEWTLFRDLSYVLEMASSDSSPKAVYALLVGKSAASFCYDPLLRIWKLLP